MNSILRRRRGMMGKKDNKILWQIKNQTVTGGFINTELPLCAIDQDFSIAYDVSFGTLVNSGNASEFKLIRLLSEAGTGYSLAVARTTTAHNRAMSVAFMENVSYSNVIPQSNDRIRFVYCHAKNSGVASCIMRLNNGTPETLTTTQAFIASSKNAILGQSSGTNQLPACTLNSVTIYSRVLSSAEINSFLGVT